MLIALLLALVSQQPAAPPDIRGARCCTCSAARRRAAAAAPTAFHRADVAPWNGTDSRHSRRCRARAPMPYTLRHAVLEEHDGVRFLHLQANAPRAAVENKAVTAVFTVIARGG